MDEVEKDIQVSPTLVKDEALNAYVRRVICDLAGDQCPSLRVYILDDPENNAFTAPNGMVVVWTGLLLRSQNEAELAFVLGHELTHYLKRHTLQNFEKTTNTAGFLAVLSIGTAGLASLPAGLLALGALASYSRDQEREADAGGFELVVRKGYDARQGAVFMGDLSVEEDANPNRKKPSAYMASHPATKERLATLSKRADEMQARARDATLGTDTHRAAIASHRAAWLEEEFTRGDFAQSVTMIKRLAAAEPNSGELQYFLGEAYRRRNAKGDLEAATAAYQAAVAATGAPSAVHRGLGLTALKLGQKSLARDSFQKYLVLEPDASDRAIVQYYLTTLGDGP